MANPTKAPLKYILAATLAAMIIITAVVYFSKSNLPVDAQASSDATIRAAVDKKTGGTDIPPLSPEETIEALASLKKMTSVLSEYGSTEKNMDDLVSYLRQQKQEPFIVRDKNKYTGEMVIVRTKTPLPGTRYFHAQYFTDENNKKFPQHMSFEFRPSPEALTQAIQAVQEAFPNLSAPSHQSPDFIQWDLGNGHVLWIKRLGFTDTSENPFNAYTDADIGSIRVAVELHLEGH